MAFALDLGKRTVDYSRKMKLPAKPIAKVITRMNCFVVMVEK